MSPATDQYDSPWKEALELYLRSILDLCFPHVAQTIDWESPIEFLDQELQEIVRDAALGQLRVDKLIKVRLLDGSEEWILLHLEVQHHSEPALAQQAMAGAHPSAVMVVANWAAQQTRRDMAERGRWKWDLTRHLHEAGFERKDILELSRLIDWLLRLPDDLEQAHRELVRNYEDQKAMRYVTSIERMAREEGQAEGRAEEGKELVLRQLRRRLGTLSPALEQRVRALPVGSVESLAEALLDFTGPADLERWLEGLG